jgi:transposase-like protein
MNTRNIAAEYRLEHWVQMMQDRAEKGLSIRAYCENVGIHENTYFYWQRKLREATTSGIQAAATEPEEKFLAPKGWATLCTSEKPAQPEGLTVEVCGCRITVCVDTDPDLFTKVCRVLKAL